MMTKAEKAQTLFAKWKKKHKPCYPNFGNFCWDLVRWGYSRGFIAHAALTARRKRKGKE